MNMTKKINVNFSSLVGLKAELLRKQAEVNEAKLKAEASVNALPQLNKKRNKKVVAEDTEKTLKNSKKTVDAEDIIAHKKSKLMLEAKARLYERLKKSKNNNDKFLVDFKNKVDEEPNEEPDEEFVDEAINEQHPIEPEENWIEYQDCFGRTRKCLREDLPHMQKKDDLIKHEIMKRSTGEDREEENMEQYPIQEKEPEIEIMRRKWEEQTQKLADKVDIHYQDILFDEARTHGVGYYAFSQDEEERIKQQENLANLRKETERRQKEMKEIKELKDRMEQNRLKAARIRQRIRAGLPAEPTEEELALENKLINSTDNKIAKNNDKSIENDNKKSSEETDDKSANIAEIDITHQKEKDNDEDKIRAFGELLGKKNHWHVMSQEEWVHKCRSQRINEFGPVYDNFQSAGFYNSSKNIDEQSANDKQLDNTEISKFQEPVKKSNMNLQNYEDNNEPSNETVSVVKNIDDHNNKNNSVEYSNLTSESNTTYELPKNATELASNPATSLSNSLLSQGQATVSYPLSHLSNNYSQNIYGYLGASKQHKLPDDMNIPLPGENTSSISDDKSTYTSREETVSHNINEDHIMAGLKYLREKFEENKK
ncbi:coiled-coil domain-containing protein 174 [Nylanderia fulva]|uniref:coiled-coil domain-containing protein 174 n=1 Tax=Nylanderia fulva TaxID=613905 RepID=UPI0010FAD5B8|nr:coiled-coil domain-containing protein 174 [Nylanderia fulva]XP_029167546.1 coiled-coil domain-containing protein 174 [Nylanderia fulva]XP_029167547.1 coiled-coil domain-containing protein 174 [Nylanderia fulva]XP_029167548.1 coiled-coil domain-containing protein 174 [Nylanderia fulva]XP_029167549.1 coiled-coil domain-containing protein 174 [Nylanderia fulva]